MSYVIVNIHANNLAQQISDVFTRRQDRIAELQEAEIQLFRNRPRYNILGFKFGPVLTDEQIIANFSWDDNYYWIPERGRKWANKLEKIANAILASSDGKLYLDFDDVEVLKYYKIKLEY